MYLSNASAGEAQPPGMLSLVVDFKVVDTIGWHRLYDGHVIDDRLAAGLAPSLLVVLDDFVLAKRQGGMLLQHASRQDWTLFHQVSSRRVVHVITKRGL